MASIVVGFSAANWWVEILLMRQQDFQSRYAARWEEFSDWLIKSQALRSRRAALPTPVTQSALDPVDVPARYRELCQHLALARDRQYSAELVINVYMARTAVPPRACAASFLAASLRQSGGSGAACCLRFCSSSVHCWP